MDKTLICLPAWEQLPDIGLYMDQITTLMNRVFMVKMRKGDLTKPMINNYVKAGLLPRPVGKKYEREHLAILFMIYVLKQALSMDSIGEILKILCAQGVHEGYEQFRNRLEELENVMAQGRVEMDWSDDSKPELILRLSLMAVLCTVRTYQLLSEQTDESSQ